MNRGSIPLFPGGNSLHMPLFGECMDNRNACGSQCQTVRVFNPACCGEYADVELCLDSCGNLSICVHRPPENLCRRKSCCRRC